MHYLYVTYIYISILNLWTTNIYAWKPNKNGMASKRDQVIISRVRLSTIISNAWCTTPVTPLLTHWSYCCLILSHRYKILSLTFCSRTRGPMQYHCFVFFWFFCFFFQKYQASLSFISYTYILLIIACRVYRMRQVVVQDGWEFVGNSICQWIFYHFQIYIWFAMTPFTPCFPCNSSAYYDVILWDIWKLCWHSEYTTNFVMFNFDVQSFLQSPRYMYVVRDLFPSEPISGIFVL